MKIGEMRVVGAGKAVHSNDGAVGARHAVGPEQPFLDPDIVKESKEHIESLCTSMNVKFTDPSFRPTAEVSEFSHNGSVC